jgi:hypothetical protein
VRLSDARWAPEGEKMREKGVCHHCYCHIFEKTKLIFLKSQFFRGSLEFAAGARQLLQQLYLLCLLGKYCLMDSLKTAVFIVYGLGLVCLVALVPLVALNVDMLYQEFVAFSAIGFFVTATLFGVFRLVKGDIKTQELYESTLSGLLAVSIFPAAAIVANWTWSELITLILLAVS